MMEETLFKGVSNTVDITLSDKDGVPIPFLSNGVTLMELHLNDQTISSVSGDIVWDDVGGISIKAGDDADKISKDIFHSTSLVVYDPTHPEPSSGQLLIHPKMKYSRLKLQIVDHEL